MDEDALLRAHAPKDAVVTAQPASPPAARRIKRAKTSSAAVEGDFIEDMAWESYQPQVKSPPGSPALPSPPLPWSLSPRPSSRAAIELGHQIGIGGHERADYEREPATVAQATVQKAQALACPCREADDSVVPVGRPALAALLWPRQQGAIARHERHELKARRGRRGQNTEPTDELCELRGRPALLRQLARNRGAQLGPLVIVREGEGGKAGNGEGADG